MKRIYTRTGDRGTTAIHGGTRVPKTDIRIEANGSLDELNVEIGAVRTFLPCDAETDDFLAFVQRTLMTIMSRVATASEQREKNPNRLPADLIERIEKMIDVVSAKCDGAEHFVLPGGSPEIIACHRARVTARRAERRLWELNASDAVEEEVLTFINRLSDLFFMLARAAELQCGCEQEKWKSFAYKNRK